jgi:mRNA interferase HigB
MRIIARRTLRLFWEKHRDSEGPLKAWFAEVEKADWSTTADIKRRYPTASIVDAERVVFNIKGNNYRLIVKVWFAGKAVWIKFVGTHADYDDVDVASL